MIAIHTTQGMPKGIVLLSSLVRIGDCFLPTS